MEKIIEEIKTSEQNIIKIILSDSEIDIKKIIVSPKNMKNGIKWQIERFIGNKVFHENVEFESLSKLNLADFKQITIEKQGETVIFAKSKSSYKRKVKENNLIKKVESHDKEKNYILKEGTVIPPLVDLGVFTRDGKIVANMHDKYKQINKFIEVIDDAFRDSNKDEITILDFGSGKSYLTFLIYYYFVKLKKVKAHVIGYDIKEDVINECNSIAKKYGYTGLEFVLSDVKKDKLFSGKIDMVVSLHACDTATDYALDFAIKNNVKYIFSVPCCQHEINEEIKGGGDFDILLKDGLIKERFSALLTDAIRIEMLRAKGYSVDAIEFVDIVATPKNILIRAVKNSTKKSTKRVEELLKKYNLKQQLFSLQT